MSHFLSKVDLELWRKLLIFSGVELVQKFPVGFAEAQKEQLKSSSDEAEKKTTTLQLP